MQHLSKNELVQKFQLSQRDFKYYSSTYGKFNASTQRVMFDEIAVAKIEEDINTKENSMEYNLCSRNFGISLDNKSLLEPYFLDINPKSINMFNGRKYVLKSTIDELKLIYPNLILIENQTYISCSVIAKKIKCNSKYLTNLCRNKKIDNFIIHPLIKSIFCIHVSEISNIEKNNLTKYTYAPKIEIDGISYLSSTEARELLNISKDSILTAIGNNKFKNITKHLNGYYIEEKEVNELLSLLNNSYEFKKLDSLDKRLSYRIIDKMKCDGIRTYFPNAFIFDVWGRPTWRITKSDFTYFLNNKLENILLLYKINEENDPHSLYNILINNIPSYDKYIKTYEAYNRFSKRELNNKTRIKIKDYARRLVSSYSILLSKLTKEIFDYTDNELAFLFKISGFNTYQHQIISYFCDYCKLFYKDLCLFSDKYNLSYWSKENLNDTQTEVYSNTEWITFFNYATDINKHIRLAFNNFMYSRAWLYLLLHFSLAWRRSDILKMPGLEIINVEKYSEEWFENNEFTLSEAQVIVDSFELRIKNRKAHKNKEILHYIIFLDLIVPTAIAIIIAERHRTFRKEKSLFGESEISNLQLYFKDCNNIKAFSNRIANRTLLSINLEEANKKVESAKLGYRMSSYMRSHKLDNKTLNSNTTAKYIYAVNNDGDIDSISYNLFRRGTFGYVYNTLIELSNNTKELSMTEMTEQIISLKNEYPVLSIEALADYIVYKHQDTLDLLNDLMKLSKQEIRDLLTKLSNGECPSKTSHTQCLKYKECPFPNVKICFGCKYNIPSIYALNGLKEFIFYHIQALKNNTSNNIIIKAKSTFLLYKCIDILKEFKTHFDVIDSNYLSAFIDLRSIQTELDVLSTNNMLLKGND